MKFWFELFQDGCRQGDSCPFCHECTAQDTACPMKSECTPCLVPNNEKISLSTSTNLQPEKRDRLVQRIAHSCSLRLFPMSFHFRGRVVWFHDIPCMMFYALLYLLHVFPIVAIELIVAAGVPSWPKMAEASTAAWEKTPASASRLAIAQWSDRPVGAVHPYCKAHSSNLDGRLKMPSTCQIASSSRSFLGIAMWNCSLQSIAKLLANIDMFFNACGGTPSPRETLDFSSLQKQPAKLSGWLGWDPVTGHQRAFTVASGSASLFTRVMLNAVTFVPCFKDSCC